MDMDSILTSIKKLLSIPEEYEQFDGDIILHINSVFSILAQLGVGPDAGFIITDKSSTWDEFVPDGQLIQNVKSYMGLKVKLMFDPPLSSAVLECHKEQIKELEWRLQVAADSKEEIQNGE